MDFVFYTILLSPTNKRNNFIEIRNCMLKIMWYRLADIHECDLTRWKSSYIFIWLSKPDIPRHQHDKTRLLRHETIARFPRAEWKRNRRVSSRAITYLCLCCKKTVRIQGCQYDLRKSLIFFPIFKMPRIRTDYWCSPRFSEATKEITSIGYFYFRDRHFIILNFRF